MNRIANLIRYFIQREPGLGRTQIVKFLYLADHDARCISGHPVTDLDYVFYHHGPFDRRIYEELDSLVQSELVREERVPFRNGCAYRYFPNPGLAPELSVEDRWIAETVLTNYGRTPLKELLEDVVYETEPMRRAQNDLAFQARLPMEVVDNSASIPGITLSDLAHAESDSAAGRTVTLEELRGRMKK